MNDLRRLLKLVYTSRGEHSIIEHLIGTYGIEVTAAIELDKGVYRIDHRSGDTWVARVFIPERTLARVEGDAAVLDYLAKQDFPAERLAAASPVSMLDEQPVLVTKFVTGKSPAKPQWVLREIGNMLGQLHAMPIASLNHEGGSLHHVPGYEGLPSEDLRLAGAALDDIQSELPPQTLDAVKHLREVIESLDDCRALPRALVHPDPVNVNLIATADKQLVLVDWAGCGIGPRLACLAQVFSLAWTTKGWDAAKMQTMADAYTRHVTLSSDELASVGDAYRMRLVWLAAWNCWTRTLSGRPPKGDEWWMKRALAPPSQQMIGTVRDAFGA